MRQATLCIPIKEQKILLGRKKKGFGKDKFNGFGGKVRPNESIEEAATREIYEEAGIKVDIKDLEKVGELTFTFPEAQEKDWDQVVHVFFVKNWENEPQESEEMTCEWFDRNSIPFDEMWDDDKHWLPLMLGGKKLKASFVFDKDNETIKHKEIFELK